MARYKSVSEIYVTHKADQKESKNYPVQTAHYLFRRDTRDKNIDFTGLMSMRNTEVLRAVNHQKQQLSNMSLDNRSSRRTWCGCNCRKARNDGFGPWQAGDDERGFRSTFQPICRERDSSNVLSKIIIETLKIDNWHLWSGPFHGYGKPFHPSPLVYVVRRI